jgi:hypothetical protein
MMHYKLFTGLCVAIAVSLSALPAQAISISKIIDNFDDDSENVTSAAVGSTSFGTTLEGAAGNIFGSERDAFVVKTSGPTAPVTLRRVAAAAADGGFGSTFFIDRGPLVNGNVLLQWDGADGVAPAAFDPLSNLSFLAGPWNVASDLGILLRLVYGETDQEIQFTLFSSATSASTHTAIALPNFSGPGHVDLLIPFASFVQSSLAGVVSPVDFTNIRAITMSATSNTAGRDAEIGLLGVYVPEPASASIFGIGSVVAMATFRRFRRKQ